MIYGKFITSSVQISLSGSVAYSNAMSLPVMLALMMFSDETSTLRRIDVNLILKTYAPVWLLASCAVGTGISYAGWWCRSQTSATSYTIVGVVNKALTVCLSRLVSWDTTTSSSGLLWLGITVGGGLLYTQAKTCKSEDAATFCSSWKNQRSQNRNSTRLAHQSRLWYIVVLGIMCVALHLCFLVIDALRSF